MAPLLLATRSTTISLTLFLLIAVVFSGDGEKTTTTTTTHLHFYWHDVVTGPHPTAIKVAQPLNPTNTTPPGFGLVVVIDDPLTLGPDLSSSQIVGRAQGTYIVASTQQSDFGLLQTMNLVFISGEFNGSSLTVIGRNDVPSPVRELTVVGGTRLFRFARGYALLTTYSLDATNGNAVVEYNVYVKHDTF